MENELLRFLDWAKIEPFCRRWSVEYLGRDPYIQQPLYRAMMWSLQIDGEKSPQMSKKGIGKTVKQAINNCIERGVPFDGNITHSWESYHAEQQRKSDETTSQP